MSSGYLVRTTRIAKLKFYCNACQDTVTARAEGPAEGSQEPPPRAGIGGFTDPGSTCCFHPGDVASGRRSGIRAQLLHPDRYLFSLAGVAGDLLRGAVLLRNSESLWQSGGRNSRIGNGPPGR